MLAFYCQVGSNCFFFSISIIHLQLYRAYLLVSLCYRGNLSFQGVFLANMLLLQEVYEGGVLFFYSLRILKIAESSISISGDAEFQANMFPEMHPLIRLVSL